MLTLYGDYVRRKGGEIGIGSLIKLMSNFDLSEQSIRSAVSRMCRAGLLKVRRDGLRSYYSLTDEGLGLLDRGAQRIFDRKKSDWDHTWSIVVYFIPEKKRQARDLLRQELSWMGYGPLGTATWISPHDSSREVKEVVKKLNIQDYIQIFQSRCQNANDAQIIMSRCWDLDRIHEKYASFITEYRPKLEEHLKRLQSGEVIEPSECFVKRFHLVHEYRRLPYFDPDLPEELLPENWLRPQAADLFHRYHDLLTEKANEYFSSVVKAY